MEEGTAYTINPIPEKLAGIKLISNLEFNFSAIGIRSCYSESELSPSNSLILIAR